MARRANNHWLDNIINYGHFPIRSNRRTTTVRNNPPIVVGNGILDQINHPHYIGYTFDISEL